jgi:hypothetical protein
MAIRRTQTQRRTLSIASGGTTSEVVNNENALVQIGALKMPAALTSTTMTYHVSVDGTNFAAMLTQAGAAFGNVAVAANAQVPLPREVLSFPFFRVVMGSAEAAARTIQLVTA